MARVLVVDDSSSVRALLSERLSAEGHEVDVAPDAETAVERVAAQPPDVVVTDLVMSGLSGVQLCRLLRGDAATAHLPVVLLTASGDKRSRFWARSAGAAAYVRKDRLDDLVALLPTIAAAPRPATTAAPAREPGRASLDARVSSILDAALFDSVFAGEVRVLASSGELARLFAGLASLLSDVLTYRWMALSTGRAYAPIFVHGHAAERETVEQAARETLGAAADAAVCFESDERPVPGEGRPPDVHSISFAGTDLGRFVVASTGKGLSAEDKHLLSLVATELGGPLQMTTLYEDARRLATTDTLTGLLNRRAFTDAIERERARSDRHEFPLSLLVVDVDHFKRINDQLGHGMGDVVLQRVARVLSGVARRSDFVGRWGGEEFVLALPQTREAGARVAAERVRRAIAEAVHIPSQGEPVRVTASIGAASAEAPWSLEALVAAADEAMYAAKARGRNRVESNPVCEPSSYVKRRRATQLASKGP